MHLAQINVGRVLHPVDDPRMAGFTDNLEAINGLAEASEGFVWRLKDESGNATAIAAYEDPAILVNMSVWTSLEALHAFAYHSAHRSFVQRRKAWFHLFDAPYLALWWIAEGHRPTPQEGRERLEHLTQFGPTAYAFTFRKAFPSGEAAPLATTGEESSGGDSGRRYG